MKKKIISIVLALCLTLALLPAGAAAGSERLRLGPRSRPLGYSTSAIALQRIGRLLGVIPATLIRPESTM